MTFLLFGERIQSAYAYAHRNYSVERLDLCFGRLWALLELLESKGLWDRFEFQSPLADILSVRAYYSPVPGRVIGVFVSILECGYEVLVGIDRERCSTTHAETAAFFIESTVKALHHGERQ